MRVYRLAGSTALTLFMAANAGATSFSNISGIAVEFPAGAVSFADELVSFSPGVIFDPIRGLDIPLPAFREGANALGPPDMDLVQSLACYDGTPTAQDCRFASLGSLGELIVRFTDNRLTGNGRPDADLWIFQAGPSDPTFVDISADGLLWHELGLSTNLAGIDIDAAGFGPDSRFALVRLRDAPGGQPSGDTLGADIDAVGAISTVVPLQGSLGFLVTAVLALAPRLRRSMPIGFHSRQAGSNPALCQFRGLRQPDRGV